MGWETGVGRYKQLHLEWINKTLTYGTRNYIQYPVISIMENYKNNICICITESFCCEAEITTTL